MDDTLTTMIVNDTAHDLIMKVGNRNCFVPLAVVKRGCHHAMELCMNWTYQEFLLEQKNTDYSDRKKLFVNSDDCCDYERITIKESSEAGKFVADRVPRKQVKPDDELTRIHKRTFTWRFWLWL